MGLNMRPRTLCCAFAVLLAWALSGAAYTVDELERMASIEIIPEISQAAGLALVDHYAATKSPEELTQLAASTRLGISLAARLALQATSGVLPDLLLASADELMELAWSADTGEERLDAARAYFLVTRATATRCALEEAASTEGSREWALAAGEVLGGFYAAYKLLSVAELEALAVESPFAGLRKAASVALSALWVADGLPLTDEQIQVKLVELTQWRPDLAEAYMGVLASRFLSKGSARET